MKTKTYPIRHVHFGTRIPAKPERIEAVYIADAKHIAEAFFGRIRTKQETLDEIAAYLERIARWDDTRPAAQPRDHGILR